jgi:hypothetical protein
MFLVHPGTCMLCGKVPDGPGEYFASLGVELEYFGAVYLCQACCAEIASFILFIDPNRFEEMAAVNETLAQKVIELQKSLAAAKEMLSARIDAAGRSEFNIDVVDAVLVPETERDSDYVDSILNGDEPESA